MWRETACTIRCSQGGANPAAVSGLHANSVAGMPAETVIPNLAAYININDSLIMFQQNPHLKRVVPVAVDRAIRDIIQPVVERSVTIGVITTRELTKKDFAMEPDESKLRQAAHLMVSNYQDRGLKSRPSSSVNDKSSPYFITFCSGSSRA